jgi:hypothetical protein
MYKFPMSHKHIKEYLDKISLYYILSLNFNMFRSKYQVFIEGSLVYLLIKLK